jgi:predicted O-linked N-acetylglucosamine transferase (SPINDLY family)
LCDHTIGQLNVGIIEQLDKNRFELVVLATGGREDAITERIRKAADRFIAVPHDIPAALDVVAQQQLDVLHYPDFGMAPFTYGLAHSRLAPVQTTTWGHPVTSGLPMIDYFVSCAHGETAESDAHYTEKLVRLPRLNVCLARPQRNGPKRSRGHFRLPDDAHVYACPQMLFKFHPDFDEALAGILRGDERGLVVTIESKYPEWKQLLVDRWSRSMPDVAERIRFLPKMPRTDFMELLACSDVMLDPFPFGGGHTSYEALAIGLPVVTLPGELLRGRLTHAMYRQMGYSELLATDVAEYVRVALSMGVDRQQSDSRRMRRLVRRPGDHSRARGFLGASAVLTAGGLYLPRRAAAMASLIFGASSVLGVSSAKLATTRLSLATMTVTCTLRFKL